MSSLYDQINTLTITYCFCKVVAKCDKVKTSTSNLDQRFDSLLQQPITRITRYELLLKDLSKWMVSHVTSIECILQ